MRAVTELIAYNAGMKARKASEPRDVPERYEDTYYDVFWLRGYDMEPIDGPDQ